MTTIASSLPIRLQTLADGEGGFAKLPFSIKTKTFIFPTHAYPPPRKGTMAAFI